MAAGVFFSETVDCFVVGDGSSLLIADVLENELEALVPNSFLPHLLAEPDGAHLVVMSCGATDGGDHAGMVVGKWGTAFVAASRCEGCKSKQAGERDCDLHVERKDGW